MSNSSHPLLDPARQLNLFDAVCINVGIIIGSGIYTATPFVSSQVAGPWQLLGMWMLGGAIALMGALCYGELATAFPHHGGEYVYLTQGIGRRMGFLFAWSEFWIIRPSNVGAMAYVFGKYAQQIFPLNGFRYAETFYASVAIALLTLINVGGVQTTKTVQNLLTAVKVLGLATICIVGLCFASNQSPTAASSSSTLGASTPIVAPTVNAASSSQNTNYQLALILILFTYGGWNEISYVAAEVQNPQRNLWRALIISTVVVATIYVLVNFAFVHALGFAGLQQSNAVAADVMRVAMGVQGQAIISVLICLSCLGAINGMIFTGARIPYALGRDHAAFAWLGEWNERLSCPMRATLLQGIVTYALVVAFGLSSKGFEQLVYFGAPVFWFFIIFVVASLFTLRAKFRREVLLAETPNQVSANRVIFFPVTPLLFGTACCFMFYRGVMYAIENLSYEVLWVVVVLAVGVGISLISPPREGSKVEQS